MVPTPEDTKATADPWSEHGVSKQTREIASRFLEEHHDAITEAGTSWVVRTAVDLQGRRPRDETRVLVDRVVELNLARLLRDDFEPQRRFIEFVTTYRASERFHISTLQRGFLSFKRGVESVLPQLQLPAEEKLRLYVLIDTCSQEVIHEMSDIYVGKLNDRIREAREREVRTEEREAQLVLERERNQALEEAKRAAEAANEAKSRFLAHMSHELRTPLNSVIGFSQYLRDDPGLDSGNRRTVDSIFHSGRALLEMINEVLEMSRIEAGAVEAKAEPVELVSFLHQVHTILAPQAPPGVRFELRPDGALVPRFLTDRSKLRQILINLLGNALKFTREGHVVCRVRQRDPGGGDRVQLEFAIEDTGPGIPDDDLRHIFDAFAQSESGRASGQGVGLGLSITESYVRLLGGRLTASSVVGEGTTFTFTLPVTVSALDVTESWPTVTIAKTESFRLLVVDDHPINRELLRLTLERWGFQVQEASGGLEAIRKTASWRPHLVFMDIRMSDLDGLEATRRIRAELGPDAPAVVAITANAFDDDRGRAMEAGCVGFLLKPFDQDALARTLYELLAPIRGPAEPASEGPSLIPAAEVLSEPERERLRVAAVQLDLARLEGWLERATDLPAATRATLKDWVDEFQFGRVLEWLDT